MTSIFKVLNKIIIKRLKKLRDSIFKTEKNCKELVITKASLRKGKQLKYISLIVIIVIITNYILFANNIQTIYALEKLNSNDLYAISACLMDADSGRVLYEKNGFEQRAMASTTKIMTLIVALENVTENIKVTVSKAAALQPQVKLGIKEGDEFYIEDLYYSLMLESHNDVAYAIAEAVAGDVKSFAKLMNDKARKIGANDTYFITPNGLDAKDEIGTHHTTATDLAKIMSYCISESDKADRFIEITRCKLYTFNDVTGTQTFSVYNHNAFLDMMDGALSGKTGFTSEAGYCYVGALKKDDRTYVVALLGCGWPNNKSYKWSDTKKLMNYGIDNFKKVNIYSDTKLESIRLKSEYQYIPYKKLDLCVEKDSDGLINLLISDEDVYEKKIDLSKSIDVPIYKNEVLGKVRYMLNGECVAEYNIYSDVDIEKINLKKFLNIILKMYLLN